jgi:hypothetical protein
VKINIFLEDDRVEMMKAMQDKRFSNVRDSMTRTDVSHLVRMIRLKGRKQDPRKGVPEDSINVLNTLGLIDDKGPTGTAKAFLRWLADNPNREMEFADKRADANIALRRGQLKRDNERVDPLQKRARKVIKSLTDDEKEIFRKLYNRWLNKRTRNLAIRWGNVPPSYLTSMQGKGIVDDDGNLTKFGEFALNYYTAFKSDPDGLERVSRERRVGNFGDARKRRIKRLRKAAD